MLIAANCAGVTPYEESVCTNDASVSLVEFATVPSVLVTVRSSSLTTMDFTCPASAKRATCERVTVGVLSVPMPESKEYSTTMTANNKNVENMYEEIDRFFGSGFFPWGA